MAYRILPSERGCNTDRMVRVVDGYQLVAMFLSHSEAVAYIESKQKMRKTPTSADELRDLTGC